MMRDALLSLLVLVLAALPAILSAQEKEAPRKSLKGWELYHALDPATRQPVFGILPGTNRNKTEAEIKASLTIVGLDKLTAELGKIAAGETVILPGNLPAELAKKIKDACARLKLEVIGGP